MEALAFVIAWPLLIFFVGFLCIAYFGAWAALSVANAFAIPLVVIFLLIVFARGRRKSPHADSQHEAQLAQSFVVSLSIGLFVPLFVHELLKAADKNLVAMVFALLAGFGFIVWAMFVKDNGTLRRANLIGGIITVVYSYSQLWTLLPAARVVAAAVGLIAAVTVGVIKFKDKLK